MTRKGRHRANRRPEIKALSVRPGYCQIIRKGEGFRATRRRERRSAFYAFGAAKYPEEREGEAALESQKSEEGLGGVNTLKRGRLKRP